MDRIDMHVDVGRVDASELLTAESGETSADVQRRVEATRLRASDRCDRLSITCNAELPARRLLSMCRLDREAGDILSRAGHRHRLSARSMHRVLRVARTIADLDDTVTVSKTHVLEAITYRLTERNEKS
jgi:magnesium chelatase family protein